MTRTSMFYAAAAILAASASGAARASTAVGWQYYGQGAGYWNADKNVEVPGGIIEGSSDEGDGPIDTIHSLPSPVSVSGGGAAPPNIEATASPSGKGSAISAVQVEYQSPRAFGAVASGSSWLNYTLEVKSSVAASVELDANVAMSLFEGGLSAAEVALNAFTGAPPAQPVNPTDSLVGAAVHDGEWFYTSDPFGSHAFLGQPENKRGALGSNGLFQDTRDYDFELQTNTQYTFQISAWAWGGYSEGDYDGPHRSLIGADVYSKLTDFDLAMEGTAASAWIDPVFFVVPTFGYDLSDYQLVGVPDGSNGDLPQSAGAVPEASTWAMLLAGFAGLAFAGVRGRRRHARE